MATTSFLSNHLRVRYTFMATSIVLLLFNFVFTAAGTHDMYMLIYFGAGILAVLIYLVPAAVFCWRDRESSWEKGWVECFYLTFQILLSWVALIWLGFMRHPWLCSTGHSYGILPLYSPWGQSTYDAVYDTSRICDMITVTIAFTSLYSLVLVIWFGWTIWLTTKVAKTMGSPWTRDLVLKQVSMGKMSKLHQWREGEDIGMGKVNSSAS